MAIAHVAEYAHLSAADVESLALDLDTIRLDVEESRGAKDRAYICRTIALQRCLDAAARLALGGSRGKAGWALGTVALAAAKCIENMEIAHNISHGQWDWMNDPEIHSTSWEWDMVGLSSQWRYAHNYRHHVFTNVVGVDDDLGYGVLRVTRDQRWKPNTLLQPLRHLLLSITFEWGIALQGLDAALDRSATKEEKSAQTMALVRKITRQAGKDYLLFPALGLRRWRRVLYGNAIANLLRNLWTYMVICCGHFPDGAKKFDPVTLEGETKAEWYLRQMLGSANFRAGPVMAFMSGNLCYQIEHHLYPDLPSNRYAAIARRVEAVCAAYDLPYTTGSLARQYLLVLRTILKLSLPDRFLSATSEDPPETASATTRLDDRGRHGLPAGHPHRRGGDRRRKWSRAHGPKTGNRGIHATGRQDHARRDCR